MRLRSLLLAVPLVLSVVAGGAGSASAGWRVTSDGAAIVETDGSTSLSLRCDNNVYTADHPNWLIEAQTLQLRGQSPTMEMVFRFDRQKPFTVMGDNRNGRVSFDEMTGAHSADIRKLRQLLKSSSRVTLTLIDQRNGVALPPMVFSLTGSRSAIGQVEHACR